MLIGKYETHKFADIFPMIGDEELEQLASDIIEHGLIQPIVLYENKILDGRNRYRACILKNIQPNFIQYNGNQPLEYVISLNLKRRHLTTTQRAVLANDILPFLEEEARKRQGARTDLQNIPELIPESSPRERESSFQAGRLFNVNERDVRVVKKLKEEGKNDLIEKMKIGKYSVSDAKREIRLGNISKQRSEIKENIKKNPITGKYSVIVIDPPWDYGIDNGYDPDGFRGTTPYPTMTLEQIKNIELPTDDNCVLWLWTTNSFLDDSFDLLKNWGFELKSILTWDKKNIGTGKWLRSQTEHCLLGIKGKPFFHNTKWSTLISEARTSHSVKPEIFYRMVDDICEGRKLDYFARKKRIGWDVYGDEIK